MSRMCVSYRYKKFWQLGAAVSQKKKKKKIASKLYLFPLCVVGEKSNALSRSCASFSSSDDDDEFWVVWQFL